MSNIAPPPMQSLYERIDHVRSTTTDYPERLREVAAELPASGIRRKLTRLAKSVEAKATAATLASSFPSLRWLLTLPSGSATTKAVTALLHQGQYEHALHQRRVSKAIYPVTLLCVALLVFFFICMFIVPIFAEMFEEFQMQLPTPTKVLVSISETVNAHLLVVLLATSAVCVMISALIWLWISDGPLRRMILGYDAKAPNIRFAVASAADQIAELRDDDVAISDALRIAAESTTEPHLRAAFAHLASQRDYDFYSLSHGRAAMFLPRNFTYAISEDAGNDTTLLRSVAANCRELSLHRRDWTSLILGPLTFALIGVTILFVITALFAPFIGLMTSLTG